MGESWNTWELVKSNNLSPTKGSLYKGMRVDRVGVGFLECEKRREGNAKRSRERQREEERRKKSGKHRREESTKRVEKIRRSIKREEGVDRA